MELVMKIIGAVFVISACSGIGFYYSGALKRRIQLLHDLNRLFLMLRGEIRYSHAPFEEAFLSIESRVMTPFKEFCHQFSQMLSEYSGKSIDHLWREALQASLSPTDLLKTDLALIEKLGDSLGYLDNDMQCKQIDLFLEQLNEVIRISESQMKEKQKLYQSLGILGGLFVTILII